MITDAKIRTKLKEVYSETSYQAEPLPSVRLVDELAIPKKICLADVVAIPVAEDAQKGMHGFEIKSEVDSLTRLESQIHYYSKVFKKCSLIVTEKHEKKALEMLPDWWGVIMALHTAEDEYGDPTDDFLLLEIKEAKDNPHPLHSYSLTQLLWRNELLEIVKTKNVEVLKSGSKRLLREAIIKQIPVEELEELVVAFLANRTEWKIPGVKYVRPKRKLSKRTKRTKIKRTKR